LRIPRVPPSAGRAASLSTETLGQRGLPLEVPFFRLPMAIYWFPISRRDLTRENGRPPSYSSWTEGHRRLRFQAHFHAGTAMFAARCRSEAYFYPENHRPAIPASSPSRG